MVIPKNLQQLPIYVMAIYKNIDMANIRGTGPINMAKIHASYIYIITTCDYQKLSQFSTLEVQHFGAKMIELVGHGFPFRMAIFDRLSGWWFQPI